VALWGADPARPAELGTSALEALSQVRHVLSAKGPAGSPLWATRSRHRRLESLWLPMDAVKAAAKTLGGSVNDVFVAGALNGAVRYHDKRGVPLETLNVSFVVSTRDDRAAGGNSFTPTPVQLPAGPMAPLERFRAVQERVAAGRAQVRGDGLVTQLARLAKLLPSSTLASLGRSQAAALDFATSNMRGAPFDTYISGGRVLHNFTLGPVAGTAFNLTALSFGDCFDMGLHIDPTAVDDPADLRSCLEAAYGELLAEAQPATRRGSRRVSGSGSGRPAPKPGRATRTTRPR
jgi:hypothetical protein